MDALIRWSCRHVLAHRYPGRKIPLIVVTRLYGVYLRARIALYGRP